MKKTVSHFVWVGHIGAALSLSGCMLLFILHKPVQLIHFTILSPLLYSLLWLCGKREQVWYDENEMTGSLAALTYIYTAFCALCVVSILFQQHGWVIETADYALSSQELYNSSLIFILSGSLLVSIRFYLNFWVHCSTSDEIEARCTLESDNIP